MKEVNIQTTIKDKRRFELDLLELLKKYGLKHEKVAINFVRIEASLNTLPKVELNMEVLED